MDGVDGVQVDFYPLILLHTRVLSEIVSSAVNLVLVSSEISANGHTETGILSE